MSAIAARTGQVAGRSCTLRLGHHHGEEPDGSVDIAEPAAVKAEEDGGLGDHGGPVADPGAGRGHWRTYGTHSRGC